VDFDVNSLLASMVPSSIGLVAFMYGKRQGRVPHMLIGVVLMIYPYFVANIFLMFGIAIVLSLGLWLAVRLGL
jgi:hypothetical protein